MVHIDAALPSTPTCKNDNVIPLHCGARDVVLSALPFEKMNACLKYAFQETCQELELPSRLSLTEVNCFKSCAHR